MRIKVLEADPELGHGLDEEALAQVLPRALAPTADLRPGPWQPSVPGDLDTHLGLLVLDGVLSRTVFVGGRGSTELVGAGDLLRPWQSTGEDGLLPVEVQWRVLQPTRLALLDRTFATAVAPWPAITAEIAGRAMRRTRWQSLVIAISHMKRVDTRLLVLLWHLADRWGRMVPEGIMVPLRLTHQMLAEIVGAQRPSVTTALKELRSQDLIVRRSDRNWVLSPKSRVELERMVTTEGDFSLDSGEDLDTGDLTDLLTRTAA